VNRIELLKNYLMALMIMDSLKNLFSLLSLLMMLT